MKKIFYILITLIIILPSTIYAARNPYPHYETILGTKDKMVNCTWYAWQQAYDKTGVALPSLGNAKNWYKKASSLGYNVGSTPKVNSIAVYTGGTFGHVAYVVSIEGDYMTVNEGGIYTYDQQFDEQGNLLSSKKVAYNNTGIYDGNISTSVVGRPRYDNYEITENTRILAGFIYLDSVPKTTTKKIMTTKKSTSKVTTVSKDTTKSTTTTESTTTTTTTTMSAISPKTTKEATKVTDKSAKPKISIELIALIVTSVVVILTIIIMLIIKKKK